MPNLIDRGISVMLNGYTLIAAGVSGAIAVSMPAIHTFVASINQVSAHLG